MQFWLRITPANPLSLILDVRTTQSPLFQIFTKIYRISIENKCFKQSKEWSTLSMIKNLRRNYLTPVFENQFIIVLSNIKTRWGAIMVWWFAECKLFKGQSYVFFCNQVNSASMSYSSTFGKVSVTSVEWCLDLD